MLSKATIKYIQSLQQKKLRNELKLFVAEGTVMLQEMLEEGELELSQVFATNDWWLSLPLNLRERYANLICMVEDYQLKQMSSRASTTGGLAVFKQKEAIIKTNFDGEIVLGLADLQDPGNLGTIIRTADWFGIKHIICSLSTVDCYNPKVVQSTMGSISRVAVYYVDLKNWLMNTSSIIYAAKIDGEDVRVIEKATSGVLLIGNEANGISNAYHDINSTAISIKKIGASESLNAAVAAGILMYAFCETK